jgi:hypothetical protein
VRLARWLLSGGITSPSARVLEVIYHATQMTYQQFCSYLQAVSLSHGNFRLQEAANAQDDTIRMRAKIKAMDGTEPAKNDHWQAAELDLENASETRMPFQQKILMETEVSNLIF